MSPKLDDPETKIRRLEVARAVDDAGIARALLGVADVFARLLARYVPRATPQANDIDDSISHNHSSGRMPMGEASNGEDLRSAAMNMVAGMSDDDLRTLMPQAEHARRATVARAEAHAAQARVRDDLDRSQRAMKEKIRTHVGNAVSALEAMAHDVRLAGLLQMEIARGLSDVVINTETVQRIFAETFLDALPLCWRGVFTDHGGSTLRIRIDLSPSPPPR